MLHYAQQEVPGYSFAAAQPTTASQPRQHAFYPYVNNHSLVRHV